MPMANVGLGFIGNIMMEDMMEPRLLVKFPSFDWPHTKELGHDHSCAHNPNQMSPEWASSFQEDQIIDGRACQKAALRSGLGQQKFHALM